LTSYFDEIHFRCWGLSVLDKQFVVASCSIGTVYAAAILGIQHFIGPNAAGVVGVALSALAVAILRQFETLRFRREAAATGTTVVVPRLRISFLLLAMAALVGVQVFVGIVCAAVFAAIKGPAALMTIVLAAIVSDTYRFILVAAGATAIAYFIGGLLIGRSSPTRPLMHAIIGSLLTNITILVVMLLPEIWSGRGLKVLLNSSSYVLGAFWLAYILSCLLGAKLSMHKIPALGRTVEKPVADEPLPAGGEAA